MGRSHPRDTPEPFVATVAVPHGGVAPRCQARNRQGRQCGRPARRGFRVCAHHGAGTAKRELDGTRKRAGRPLEGGLYSKQRLVGVHDLMQSVEELQRDLDNSDAEVIVAKAALWSQLNLAPDAEAVRAHLHDAIEEGSSGDLQQLIDAGRLVTRLEGYTARLQDLAAKIVNIQRVRSQIATAAIDAKVKDQLVRDVLEIRGVLEEHLDPDTYAAIYAGIMRALRRSRGVELRGAEAGDA